MTDVRRARHTGGTPRRKSSNLDSEAGEFQDLSSGTHFACEDW